ncbi:hypothetical protein AcW1_008670 [Taiwanofungus camphoratus]|nr:hypothetical protein AcW1_008670 [Antrodia cinnamomea]
MLVSIFRARILTMGTIAITSQRLHRSISHTPNLIVIQSIEIAFLSLFTHGTVMGIWSRRSATVNLHVVSDEDSPIKSSTDLFDMSACSRCFSFPRFQFSRPHNSKSFFFSVPPLVIVIGRYITTRRHGKLAKQIASFHSAMTCMI